MGTRPHPLGKALPNCLQFFLETRLVSLGRQRRYRPANAVRFLRGSSSAFAQLIYLDQLLTLVNNATMSSAARPEISPKARLALEAVEVFGQLAGLYEERRRQLAESVGLTIVQWQALEQVQHEHFMPSMFAAQRESSAAAVSKVLRQLVDKGLVIASLSDKDGRQREYNVTDRGRQLLDDVRQQRQRAIAEIWMKLASDELEQFVDFGRKVAHRLDNWATTEARQTSRAVGKK